MRNTILIAVISLVIISCNKNKFSSAPQLKFKSVNTHDVFEGQTLQIKLSFTDKEGDLQDSIFVEQYSTNCTNTHFKDLIKIPAFPIVSNTEGDILISYGYRVPPVFKEPQCNVTDTCYFRFALKDKAQNKSDTVQTDAIYIHK